MLKFISKVDEYSFMFFTMDKIMTKPNHWYKIHFEIKYRYISDWNKKRLSIYGMNLAITIDDNPRQMFEVCTKCRQLDESVIYALGPSKWRFTEPVNKNCTRWILDDDDDNSSPSLSPPSSNSSNSSSPPSQTRAYHKRLCSLIGRSQIDVYRNEHFTIWCSYQDGFRGFVLRILSLFQIDTNYRILMNESLAGVMIKTNYWYKIHGELQYQLDRSGDISAWNLVIMVDNNPIKIFKNLTCMEDQCQGFITYLILYALGPSKWRYTKPVDKLSNDDDDDDDDCNDDKPIGVSFEDKYNYHDDNVDIINNVDIDKEYWQY